MLQAVLALAWYDGDSTRGLSGLDRLLELFPDNGRLLLWKLDSLRERDQRDERLALLREVCSRREAPPIFHLRYAEELTEDAREFADACYWARRALRNGARLGGVSCLAGLLWMQQPSLEALELYRFAACLNDKNESAARQYFHAARHLNQTEQAILFLRARFARFGHISAGDEQQHGDGGKKQVQHDAETPYDALDDRIRPN